MIKTNRNLLEESITLELRFNTINKSIKTQDDYKNLELLRKDLNELIYTNTAYKHRNIDAIPRNKSDLLENYVTTINTLLYSAWNKSIIRN